MVVSGVITQGRYAGGQGEEFAEQVTVQVSQSVISGDGSLFYAIKTQNGTFQCIRLRAEVCCTSNLI